MTKKSNRTIACCLAVPLLFFAGTTQYSPATAASYVETSMSVSEPATISTDSTIGDVNGDSKVTANDAQIILAFAALAGSDPLQASISENADVNADGTPDATDAALVLQYAAVIGSGGNFEWPPTNAETTEATETTGTTEATETTETTGTTEATETTETAGTTETTEMMETTTNVNFEPDFNSGDIVKFIRTSFHIRSKPSSSSEDLGIFSTGQMILVLHYEYDGWYKTRILGGHLDGVEGYIRLYTENFELYYAATETTVTTTTTTVTTTTTTTGTFSRGDIVQLVGEPQPYYATPNENEKLGWITSGQCLTVLFDEEQGWYTVWDTYTGMPMCLKLNSDEFDIIGKTFSYFPGDVLKYTTNTNIPVYSEDGENIWNICENDIIIVFSEEINGLYKVETFHTGYSGWASLSNNSFKIIGRVVG